MGLFFFLSVSEHDICEIVQKLKHSSCFKDVVPVRLFKEVAGTKGSILQSIVNSSLISGCVPEELKIATFQPILKKPSLCPAVVNNCRPISKLPFIPKNYRKRQRPKKLLRNISLGLELIIALKLPFYE